MSFALRYNWELSQKSRNKWIDYLKTIAIVLIIITHDPWSVENAILPVYPLIVDMAVPIFMIVSGYNYACSCQRKNISKIKGLYSIIELKEKMLRFLIPFGMMYTCEILLLVLFKHEKYTISKLLTDMIMGGYGPGAYYTPIMIQFIFITPLLYICVSKYKKKGLYSIFVINIIFECAYTLLDIPGGLYSRCIFRYLFLIVLGISWREFLEEGIDKIFLLVSFVVGVIYVIGSSYIWEPVIFRRWTTTSMMVGFYLLPLLIVFRTFAECQYINPYLGNAIILCSKASFHIYLFQMIYYYVGVERIFDLFPVCIRIILSIFVCLFGGCIFYYFTELFKTKRGREKV